jgi:hypothetical protein
MYYAIMCCPDSTIQIYEKGIAVGPLGNPYSEDDVFSVGVEPSDSALIVRYYQNDQLLYTSSANPELPMRAAVSLREEGASIKQSRMYGYWMK